MPQLTISARVVRAVLSVLVVFGGLAVGPLSTPTATAATGDVGIVDQSFTGVTNPPTSDKPQSKLWFNDGRGATLFPDLPGQTRDPIYNTTLGN